MRIKDKLELLEI